MAAGMFGARDLRFEAVAGASRGRLYRRQGRGAELGIGARRVGCARLIRPCRDLRLHIDLGAELAESWGFEPFEAER